MKIISKVYLCLPENRPPAERKNQLKEFTAKVKDTMCEKYRVFCDMRVLQLFS